MILPRRHPIAVVAACVAVLCSSELALAVTVGTYNAEPGHHDGRGPSFSPLGTIGPITQGRDFEEGGQVGSSHGLNAGNNVCVCNVSNAEVQEAYYFRMRWRISNPTTCGTFTHEAELDVSGYDTPQQVCSDAVHPHGSFDCSMPSQHCSNNASCMFIVLNGFGCIKELVFLHEDIAAQRATVTITGLSDQLAATVNQFTISVDGVAYALDAGDFAGVSNQTGLFNAIAGVLPPSLTLLGIDGAITIEGVNEEELTLSNLTLGEYDPGTFELVTLGGFDTATAAAVNAVSVVLDGDPVDFSGVDFDAVTDATELCSVLDGAVELGCDVSGSTLLLRTAEHRDFDMDVVLRALPELESSDLTVDYAEGAGFVNLDDGLTVDAFPATLGLVGITFSGSSPGEDELALSGFGSATVSVAGGYT